MVNNQTLASYARTHGWEELRKFFIKIKVGIKVIDEAHKFFENTLMIDYFTFYVKERELSKEAIYPTLVSLSYNH